jgi:GDPmannose 4,6-dehydratase
VERSFAEVGRQIEWSGKGAQETGRDPATGDVVVAVDERYYRPTEVDLLLGDPAKARKILGWKHKTTFKQLVSEMVSSEITSMKRERITRERIHVE